MRRSSPCRLGVRSAASAGVRYDILGTFPFRHGGTLLHATPLSRLSSRLRMLSSPGSPPHLRPIHPLDRLFEATSRQMCVAAPHRPSHAPSQTHPKLINVEWPRLNICEPIFYARCRVLHA
ncbi:hypothetical protein E2C01_052819 [Portunus trituberculatus]|uniref:Uncharacterized protein n=1 Tax=Portunus trituberculatus TaxID=210409 RepID=A0A5B7GEQ2_PORTR|nr:hypothetical protein [Portunus trituberculatus]